MAGHDRIVESALKLPESERAEIARKILDSLNDEPDADVEKAWAAEVQKRIEDLTAGRTRTVSSADALATARSRIQP